MATFDTDHIKGSDSSFGNYFVSYNEPSSNSNASYINGQGDSLSYNADYFLAYTVDEGDQYDAKKYFFNECKDKVDTTPPTLFDPSALYRAETSYTGNLVLMQKFYQTPFSIDIHFGYRDQAFSKEDMDIDTTTAAIAASKAAFDREFEDKIMNSTSSVSHQHLESVLMDKAWAYTKKAQVSDAPIKNTWRDNAIATGKYALSNMLGSMTYMHGDRMVLNDGLVVKEKDNTLFAVVPDRPDHARGFMWDEGFHQHLVSLWNMDLTIDIIESWFN